MHMFLVHVIEVRDERPTKLLVFQNDIKVTSRRDQSEVTVLANLLMIVRDIEFAGTRVRDAGKLHARTVVLPSQRDLRS